MNAYLTYAAMIGAGLYGIEHGLELAARVQGQRLRRDGRAAHAAGAVGGDRRARALRARPARSSASDVVDHYLNAARVEQQLYDSVVHNWDRERYLERG